MLNPPPNKIYNTKPITGKTVKTINQLKIDWGCRLSTKIIVKRNIAFMQTITIKQIVVGDTLTSF